MVLEHNTAMAKRVNGGWNGLRSSHGLGSDQVSSSTHFGEENWTSDIVRQDDRGKNTGSQDVVGALGTSTVS